MAVSCSSKELVAQPSSSLHRIAVRAHRNHVHRMIPAACSDIGNGIDLEDQVPSIGVIKCRLAACRVPDRLPASLCRIAPDARARRRIR
jgi:hypothetical protein